MKILPFRRPADKIDLVAQTPWIFLTVFLLHALAFAAPDKASVQPRPLSDMIENGFVAGGESGSGFSILKIEKRRSRPAGKAERIIITYGDQRGRPLKKPPGYFHVSVDENPPRVVIDLAQVQKTAVDDQDLARLLADSILVKSTDMTMDPEDMSTNLTLLLKKQAHVKVSYALKSTGAQLIIDLRPRAAKE
jgi:hypothetical protein